MTSNVSKITIAIDGFSSTGKSTVAKQLANRLGYVYVDTGAMYRAVTFWAMENGFFTAEGLDKSALVANLDQVQLQFVFNPQVGFGEMYLNGQNVESAIRGIEVSNRVSYVAEISEVRAKLVEQQQEMGAEKGIVMDGRDIGTVVFPDAELKIFMTASPQVRAQRRFDELQAKGQSVSLAEIEANVNERDYVDTHRADSPLRKAADALELDNSALTREEQLQIILGWVENRLS